MPLKWSRRKEVHALFQFDFYLQTISKGISTVGDTVNWLASKSRLASSGEVTPPAAPSTTKNEHSWSGQRPSSAGSMEKDEDGVVPGLVTILDVQKIIKKTKSVWLRNLFYYILFYILQYFYKLC